jgi:hypothetical protein
MKRSRREVLISGGGALAATAAPFTLGKPSQLFAMLSANPSDWSSTPSARSWTKTLTGLCGRSPRSDTKKWKREFRRSERLPR